MSYIVTGIMAASLALVSFDADAAKRMGGGKSFGKQSNNVTQRDAAPAAPAAAPGAAAAAKPSAPAAAGAAAAAPKKPWGAMLGGLAAGLGLAWLASSLGLGEAFGQILMFGLLALLIMVAVGWFMRRRAQGQGNMQQNSPYAMAGAGAGGAPNVPTQRSYSPENVGNDASARPWERNSTAFQAQPQSTGGSLIGSRLSGGASNWTIPADFDAPAFLATAKQAFVALQAAWDKNDVKTLGTMMTDEMLREIRQQLSERDQHTGAGANHTEVAALDAKLLGIEDTGSEWMASVEFSGMIKEDPSQSPGPFREVWNMTKPKDGSAGWLVAGLQALN
ncbi:Tim44-like domain-containing protein [Variovorax sp. PCZ-1]|uniref:Tim44 domain-containing protein n=1 Tax=Variovorax sp. PCZ-1 TaxID=2835533 RepID=UPI001BD128C5|nr:Tim44-like domain-containing protein [Variovorax sp. PCZ-1]MBS7808024.1 Tim44 domain-containing protein [Variovorax sp. PCZ-1]